MTSFICMFIALGCQAIAYRMGTHGRGRYLTVSLARFGFLRFKKLFLESNFQAATKWLFLALFTRTCQMAVLFVFSMAGIGVSFVIGWDKTAHYFQAWWIVVISLYLDDILTGIDKDKWKRRFRAVKNSIKWRWTPAPIPVRVNV